MPVPATARLLAADLGLLLLRLLIAAIGIAHGGQKLFGLFGGKGIQGFAEFLTSLKVPMPTLSAYLAGGAEFFCGILIGCGLFTRVAVIPFAFTMAVAILTVHKNAFFLPAGMEFALTLGVIAIALGLTGPGRLSLDSAFLSRVPVTV